MDIIARSGNWGDVQDAVDQVRDENGGTAHVPAGDFPFEPADGHIVKGYGGVSIVGAGKDKTIFRNEIPVAFSDWPTDLFFVIDGSGQGGNAMRLQGFTVIGFRELYPNHDARSKCIRIQNIKDFIVYDVKIKDVGGGGIGAFGGGTYITRGVLSHCDLINKSGIYAGPGGIASGPNVLGYGVQVGGSGRAADWIDDISQVLGKYDYGRDVVYVEDCYLERWRHDIASNQNAHYVFRHNVLAGSLAYGTLDAHGPGFGNEKVGTRAVEVYNNILGSPAPDAAGQLQATMHRGGGGVYFGNTFGEGYRHSLYLANESSGIPELAKYWTNDVFHWNNTIPPLCNTVSKYDPLGQIIENVHYHANAPPFAYTPVSHPHYLIKGILPPPTCADLLTQAECEAAGCYWYDLSCHSTPKPPPVNGDGNDIIPPQLFTIFGYWHWPLVNKLRELLGG